MVKVTVLGSDPTEMGRLIIPVGIMGPRVSELAIHPYGFGGFLVGAWSRVLIAYPSWAVPVCFPGGFLAYRLVLPRVLRGGDGGGRKAGAWLPRGVGEEEARCCGFGGGMKEEDDGDQGGGYGSKAAVKMVAGCFAWMMEEEGDGRLKEEGVRVLRGGDGGGRKASAWLPRGVGEEEARCCGFGGGMKEEDDGNQGGGYGSKAVVKMVAGCFAWMMEEEGDGRLKEEGVREDFPYANYVAAVLEVSIEDGDDILGHSCP
ncbi:OLC1v1012416C1 [Oldenlandia corymbosa var. corymbosa]|uniref:OLC1v1012416C1 n=1 Tax=Oldenlandia corymbosa var. corymbosa TaxID=529605 RepID=A0AAV1DYW8_OLDCO|nr:OLC1v1012416C1 [Oldenlandia corymbosa var. corymbosa]